MGTLESPRKLTKGDARNDFCSGAEELDTWLHEYAMQNQKANNAVIYVSVLDGSVVGYYAICTAGLSKNAAPEQFAKGRPGDIPCVLLARLAVDSRMQGKGVGKALLMDAIRRSCAAAESIGAACLLVHCRDAEAKSFYRSVFNGFLQSPVEELHLLLPIKDAKRAI